VQAGESGEKRGDPCLPSELPFECVEEGEPILGAFEAPDRRQYYGGDETDSADPKNDGQNVNRPHDRHVIHGSPLTHRCAQQGRPKRCSRAGLHFGLLSAMIGAR